MHILSYDDFMGVRIETWVHSTRGALVQWSRRHRPFSGKRHGLNGFCSHFTGPSAVEVHLGPYEPGNMVVLHEFQHAVDFVSLHTPRTHDRMEVRAYLLCALVEMYRAWRAAGYSLEWADFGEADWYIARAKGSLKQ